MFEEVRTTLATLTGQQSIKIIYFVLLFFCSFVKNKTCGSHKSLHYSTLTCKIICFSLFCTNVRPLRGRLLYDAPFRRPAAIGYDAMWRLRRHLPSRKIRRLLFSRISVIYFFWQKDTRKICVISVIGEREKKSVSSPSSPRVKFPERYPAWCQSGKLL